MDNDGRLHESFRLHHSQINLESTQLLRYQSRVHQLIDENLLRLEGICTDRCRVQHVRDQERNKQGDFLSSLLLNTVLQNSLKEVTQRWQKKKGMGIYMSDQDHDCLTNLRFADDLLLFATSKEQIQKMMYEFKESTEKVGPRIHPGKTKVLSNQSSSCPDSKKRNANRRCQI